MPITRINIKPRDFTSRHDVTYYLVMNRVEDLKVLLKLLCRMQSVDNTELWYYYYEKQISHRVWKKKIALVNHSWVNRGWHSFECHDTGHCRPSSGLAILAAWKSICWRWQDERSQLTALGGSTWYVATGTKVSVVSRCGRSGWRKGILPANHCVRKWKGGNSVEKLKKLRSWCEVSVSFFFFTVFMF